MSSRAYLRPPFALYQVLAAAVAPLVIWGAVSAWSSRLGTLEHLYLADYVRTSFLPDLSALSSLSILGHIKKEPATEAKVLLCYTVNWQEIPVTGDYIEPRLHPHLSVVKMRRGTYNSWLRRNIYGKRLAAQLLMPPFLIGATLAAGLWIGAFFLDQERHLAFRSQGRHLDGPRLVTPCEFKRVVKGDGLGLSLDRGRWRKPGVLRIEQAVESQHILFMGDQGAGKTSGILSVTDYAEAMGESCVLLDPHCELLKRYYDPARGDVILGPDNRTAYWDPSSEIDYSSASNATATSLAQAASLFPGNPGRKDWFFTDAARRVLQHAMTNYRPDAGELADLMTNADPLIDAIAAGTELEEMLKKNAEGQRAGIISTLTQCLFALRQIPSPDEGRPIWCAREWSMKRRGWIFLTSTKETREAFAPLQRLWIDSLIMRLLSMGAQPQLPQVRVILDELPALGELSQLQSAVSEARKSGLSIAMGFQGRSQIKAIYGDVSEAIFSAPFTKVILRTGEPESGEWASKILGDEELERIREHRAPDGKRSYTTEQRIERVATQSDLAGLKNRHGFVRYMNMVVPVKIAIAAQRPDRTVGFVPRVGEPPKTLPMPNLAEIRAKQDAERAKKAAAAAAYVYQPGKPRLGDTKKRKGGGGQEGLWSE